MRRARDGGAMAAGRGRRRWRARGGVAGSAAIAGRRDPGGAAGRDSGLRAERGAGEAWAARRRCGDHKPAARRDSGERDQDCRGAPMRQASRVWAIGRRAHSTKLQAAVTKRPSSAGKFFAPCMISDPSTRKAALDGKISAPCIQNRPIAPGNGHMGRGSCHFYPEKHA